jgi:hypothetical protein
MGPGTELQADAHFDFEAGDMPAQAHRLDGPDQIR